MSKTDPRVVAYGEVDELQASIGSAAAGLNPELREMTIAIQRDLFALGARLADPAHKIAPRVAKVVIDDASVARLEGWIGLESDFLRSVTSSSLAVPCLARPSILRAPFAGARSEQYCRSARRPSSRSYSFT